MPQIKWKASILSDKLLQIFTSQLCWIIVPSLSGKTLYILQVIICCQGSLLTGHIYTTFSSKWLVTGILIPRMLPQSQRSSNISILFSWWVLSCTVRNRVWPVKNGTRWSWWLVRAIISWNIISNPVNYTCNINIIYCYLHWNTRLFPFPKLVGTYEYHI